MSKAEKFAEKRHGKKAEKIAKDKERLGALIGEAKEKLKNEDVKSKLGGAYDTLLAFLRLIKAYVKGDYRSVGLGTIITIVIAILYFLNPLDLIPDFLFAVGLLDDVSVILWAGNKLVKEIDEFREWEKSQGQESEA
ncbi:MAG: DUF1232 domain-containing protein [Deltaproteobacteria bacterium]|jgi:uncharacterized membrane protein YkvA (DUF1232 family)|nr:MAG: DUF1232 domain-containing protein [Deltaproteobacteria bacterium]TNF29697.1 MAG: DUF1232 domain-containing protein [Deltaproteobacteria bacterium]